jgi:hypothetical protein
MSTTVGSQASVQNLFNARTKIREEASNEEKSLQNIHDSVDYSSVTADKSKKVDATPEQIDDFKGKLSEASSKVVEMVTEKSKDFKTAKDENVLTSFNSNDAYIEFTEDDLKVIKDFTALLSKAGHYKDSKDIIAETSNDGINHMVKLLEVRSDAEELKPAQKKIKNALGSLINTEGDKSKKLPNVPKRYNITAAELKQEVQMLLTPSKDDDTNNTGKIKRAANLINQIGIKQIGSSLHKESAEGVFKYVKDIFTTKDNEELGNNVVKALKDILDPVFTAPLGNENDKELDESTIRLLTNIRQEMISSTMDSLNNSKGLSSKADIAQKTIEKFKDAGIEIGEFENRNELVNTIKKDLEESFLKSDDINHTAQKKFMKNFFKLGFEDARVTKDIKNVDTILKQINNSKVSDKEIIIKNIPTSMMTDEQKKGALKTILLSVAKKAESMGLRLAKLESANEGDSIVSTPAIEIVDFINDRKVETANGVGLKPVINQAEPAPIGKDQFTNLMNLLKDNDLKSLNSVTIKPFIEQNIAKLRLDPNDTSKDQKQIEQLTEFTKSAISGVINLERQDLANKMQDLENETSEIFTDIGIPADRLNNFTKRPDAKFEDFEALQDVIKEFFENDQIINIDKNLAKFGPKATLVIDNSDSKAKADLKSNFSKLKNALKDVQRNNLAFSNKINEEIIKAANGNGYLSVPKKNVEDMIRVFTNNDESGVINRDAILDVISDGNNLAKDMVELYNNEISQTNIENATLDSQQLEGIENFNKTKTDFNIEDSDSKLKLIANQLSLSTTDFNSAETPHEIRMEFLSAVSKVLSEANPSNQAYRIDSDKEKRALLGFNSNSPIDKKKAEITYNSIINRILTTLRNDRQLSTIREGINATDVKSLSSKKIEDYDKAADKLFAAFDKQRFDLDNRGSGLDKIDLDRLDQVLEREEESGSDSSQNIVTNTIMSSLKNLFRMLGNSESLAPVNEFMVTEKGADKLSEKFKEALERAAT